MYGAFGILDLNNLTHFLDESFVLDFASSDKGNFHFFFADLDTSSPIALNVGIMFGDNMKAYPGREMFYNIALTEVHWMEESGECTSYGDEAEFKTYADCVAAELASVYQPILGCKIPWQVTNMEDPAQCQGIIELSEETFNNIYFYQIAKLIDKIYYYKAMEISDKCLKPCLELVVDVKKRYVKEIGGFQKKHLIFSKAVKVLRHKKAYDFFDLVVEVGSCLGLWIGFSAISLFDFILEYSAKMKKLV